eukprot:1180937-Prorocentrum_minimum.AAC.1
MKHYWPRCEGRGKGTYTTYPSGVRISRGGVLARVVVERHAPCLSTGIGGLWVAPRCVSGWGPQRSQASYTCWLKSLPCAVTLYMLYLYLGEWNPRVWDMSEVYNPMYPTSSHWKSKGVLSWQGRAP